MNSKLIFYTISDFDDTFDATADDNQPEDAPTCIVTGCNFQYNKNQKRFKVYPFPKTPEMVVKWLQKLKIPNFSPSSDEVVCYKHFHEHDIVPRFGFCENKILSILSDFLSWEKLTDE